MAKHRFLLPWTGNDSLAFRLAGAYTHSGTIEPCKSAFSQRRDTDAAGGYGFETQSPRQANRATCLTTTAAKYQAANELLSTEVVNAGTAALEMKKSSG